MTEPELQEMRAEVKNIGGAKTSYSVIKYDGMGRVVEPCRLCGRIMHVDTVYESMGACSTCARALGAAWFLKHTGIPEQTLDPEAYEVYSQRRKAERAASYRKKPLSARLRLKVFERDGYACRHCGSREKLRADHIIAEVKGGETTLDNLQTLCESCNCRKGPR